MKQMKKISVKLISLMLLASMIVGMAACASENEQRQNGGETTAAEETTERLWLDSLPDKMDFNGMTIVCDYYDQSLFTGNPDGTTEVVGKAGYDKCCNVMSRLNLDVQMPQREKYTSQDLAISVQSDLNEYDLYLTRSKDDIVLCTEGYLIDMTAQEEFSLIDLKQQWWSEEFTNELNMGDYKFWIYGMITGEMENQAYCVYVNKAIYELLPEEKSIYEIVKNDEWTLDQLGKLSKEAYLDDGDGAESEEDRYGFGQQMDNFIDVVGLCAGAVYTKRDAENIPYAAISDERNISINEKFYDLLNDQSYLKGSGEGAFVKGNLLFFAECTDVAGRLRDMKDDWTMIPMPKLREDDEKYMTTVHQSFTAAGIPITTSPDKYEAIFALLEMSAAEHCRLVRPAILDEAMKNKYSRDEETKEMVDLITEVVTTDFATIYPTGLGSIFAENSATTRDIASILARKEKPISKKITGYYDQLTENVK